MALVVKLKQTPEQRDKVLTNVILMLARTPGGMNRAQAIARLQAAGFDLLEIQDKFQQLVSSNKVEVVDDGKG